MFVLISYFKKSMAYYPPVAEDFSFLKQELINTNFIVSIAKGVTKYNDLDRTYFVIRLSNDTTYLITDIHYNELLISLNVS